MTDRTPDFDELVGGSDLADAERDRLRRVHDLLVEAGPPPDWEGDATAPSPPATVTPLGRRARRRRFALVALAAAFVVAAFGLGYLAGGNGGASPVREVAMGATSAAAGASASLEVYDRDRAGNWPINLTVERLRPAKDGNPYELWLSKAGKLAALCGSFRSQADGHADVSMTVPYRLTDFDGWVVVEEGSGAPLLTTA